MADKDYMFVSWTIGDGPQISATLPTESLSEFYADMRRHYGEDYRQGGFIPCDLILSSYQGLDEDGWFVGEDGWPG